MTLSESKDFVRWIGKYALIWMLIVIAYNCSPFGRDNTDPAWPGRSDMELKIDAMTGCQYLVSGGGGITPRLDAGGSHVGCIE